MHRDDRRRSRPTAAPWPAGTRHATAVSEPTAAVPAGSASAGLGDAGQHVAEHGLVDLFAGELAVPDHLADRLKALGPRRPARWWCRCRRSRTARSTPPLRQARPGLQGGQRGGGIGDQLRRRAVGGQGRLGAQRGAQVRRRPPGPQYAGYRDRDLAGGGHRCRPRGPSRRAPRRSACRRDATTRPERPAAPGRRPARRSPTSPGRARSGSGFSLGSPTSGARWSNSVSTDRRVTGGTARAGRPQVGHADRQPQRVAHIAPVITFLTIAARRADQSR